MIAKPITIPNKSKHIQIRLLHTQQQDRQDHFHSVLGHQTSRIRVKSLVIKGSKHHSLPNQISLTRMAISIHLSTHQSLEVIRELVVCWLIWIVLIQGVLITHARMSGQEKAIMLSRMEATAKIQDQHYLPCKYRNNSNRTRQQMDPRMLTTNFQNQRTPFRVKVPKISPQL